MQADRLRSFSGLLLLLLLAGCGTKKLAPEAYRTWMLDYENGLHKKKQIDNIVFDVQYTPHELMALNEGTTDAGELEKRKAELKGKDYFIIRISVAGDKTDFIRLGVQDDKEFYQKLYYYSFDFQKDIVMEEEGKLIPCQLFHFERSYDLTNTRTFVVAFNHSENAVNKDKTIIIDSKDLGFGPVKMLFDKKKFNSVPELKL